MAIVTGEGVGLEELFRKVDTDNSGEIDEDEFSAYVRLCVREQPGLDFETIPQGDIDACFHHIDTDDSGMIDMAEFRTFFGEAVASG